MKESTKGFLWSAVLFAAAIGNLALGQTYAFNYIVGIAAAAICGVCLGTAVMLLIDGK